MVSPTTHNNYPKAVICASQRSGTTAFHSVLRNNQIYCPGEIFHPDRDNDDAFFSFLKSEGNISYVDYMNDPRAIWDRYCEFLAIQADGKDIVLDVKYNSWHQFNGPWHQPTHQPRLLTYLNPRTWIIHIIRRSVFDQVMSGFVAQQRGKFHSSQVEDLTSLRFSVNLQSFQKRVDLILGTRKKYEEWLAPRNRVITFYYEEMFDVDKITDETHQKLVKAGLTLDSLYTDLRKPKSNYELMVTNYSELKDLHKAAA